MVSAENEEHSARRNTVLLPLLTEYLYELENTSIVENFHPLEWGDCAGSKSLTPRFVDPHRLLYSTT